MKVWIAAAALLGATPAYAAPGIVYLACDFGGNPKMAVQLTVDEANGAVTYYLPYTGHSERMTAAFGPEEVAFKSRSMQLLLSRVDLSLARYFAISESVDRGQCKVRETPKRAF